MRDALLSYIKLPGTWAGLVSAIAGVVSARYGDPAGQIVTQLLLLAGGVMIGVPK